MQLCDIFLGLGEDSSTQLVRSISLGKLKTYQLFDRLKTRFHVNKLNSETLRKAAPRCWERLEAKDDEFATDLAQAILVSHLELIKEVLNHLGIPHEDGFFAKDIDASTYLKEGWEQNVFDAFREKYTAAVLLFYINHLGWEVAKADQVFAPAADSA
ncbi:MAG TPA: hypothetical protein VKV15_18200 [Bryobacteraceae bacterium]|nr:hypothetical protein [Bryobacteraceae bacterium]